jgi:hypothetical protein
MVSTLVANSPIDAVPEFYPYEDTGCEMAASCLNCPLPRCKYDDPVWYQKNRRLAKDLKVYAAIEAEMLSAEAAAERFSVTVRTIFRIMERCREALGNSETRQDMVLFAA